METQLVIRAFTQLRSKWSERFIKWMTAFPWFLLTEHEAANVPRTKVPRFSSAFQEENGEQDAGGARVLGQGCHAEEGATGSPALRDLQRLRRMKLVVPPICLPSPGSLPLLHPLEMPTAPCAPHPLPRTQGGLSLAEESALNQPQLQSGSPSPRPLESGDHLHVSPRSVSQVANTRAEGRVRPGTLFLPGGSAELSLTC